MEVCPSCGQENPQGARFCNACAAPISTEAPAGVRKTVTVLFCDLVGSTALGDRSDPELLHELMGRYHRELRIILERHGGTVEKFVGDAAMAVFGIPQAHEDDALRATRSAKEIRDAVGRLGLKARIGVNTGEVVAGEGETLVTGDAVNIAARLEQAAEEGEILIGEATERLVRDGVRAEAVEPLDLKGKAEPVPAYRLLELLPDVPAFTRPLQAPFVGRGHELETLARTLAGAIDERSPRLVTIVGPPGIGKSRLARELIQSSEASVLIGRCLSYGEGITYWPLAEVVTQAGDLRAALGDEGDSELAAARIAAALGTAEAAASSEEIAWGFRKLFEALAQAKPLIVVLDDIHWAEPTLLDLIEYVSTFAQDAPLLLLCMARPDLFELRPAWAAPRPNATLVTLEPLAASQTETLIDQLHDISGESKARIVKAAEGNPLFVEQLVAMQVESGNGELAIPPTIRALLAARIDRLEPEERSVLERASIEGRLFHCGAVAELLPEKARTDVGGHLLTLVRKEFVRADRTAVPGDDGFRFGHILIRDAAYDSIPKRLRAELHERFADWLESKLGDEASDEILGYHLEQAARYKRELGQPDATLAERAGDCLAIAGRLALWRGDLRAAARLLERALELTRPTRLEVGLELDLAQALSRESPKAAAIADAAAERARAAGDETGEALARVVAANHRSRVAGDLAVDEMEELARKALPLLEQAADHAGLVHLWTALAGGVASARGRFEDQAHAAEQALRHARLAGQRSSDLHGLEDALTLGPRPADDALRALDALLPEYPHPWTLLMRAWLLTMLGRFEEASQITSEAAEQGRELSGDDSVDSVLSQIAATAGDHKAAAVHLRRYCDMVEARGQGGLLSTYAPALGRSLCALGRHNEAKPLARLGRELGDEQDAVTQALWRQVQALVHAHRGEHAEAEAIAREAVAIAERTDGLNMQGDAFCDLAEVLRAADRSDEAAATLAQALERYQQKKNHAQAAQVRQRLAGLQDSAPR